ncbi:MAG: hypothetical protein ACFFCE_14020 [Promethearchaeota archaeon]
MKIVDHFQEKNINPVAREIWISNSIIELMKLLKQTRNKDFVANAIILLLSLFEKRPTDLYSNRGHHINNISKKDKKFLISELKDEFLPN